VTVTDDLQRTVTVPAPLGRIVSLAPSITESLFAIGAGPALVGVTEYCNSPPAAAHITRVGGMTSPNLETILALRPDLVLMSMEGNLQEDFSRFTRLNIPVVVTNPRSFEGIFRSLQLLGELTRRETAARALVDSLQRRLASVRLPATREPVGTLLFVSLQPPVVAGGKTFLHEILSAAGARNLGASAPGTYPALSREAILAADPDVIFVTSDLLPEGGDVTELFPEWGSLRAVRQRRVYPIDPDMVSRPGPRAVDAVELISSLLHSGTP
jgi:iron complex transport system substrate-binding protein